MIFAQFDWGSIDMSFAENPVYIYVVIVYFVIFGIINIQYAYKSRNNPEKIPCQPKYFKNELLVGVMYFVLAGFYPFLFNNVVPDPYVRGQIYFHLWNSLSIHILCWLVAIQFWRWNNRRHKEGITFEAWKEQIRSMFKDNLRSDFKRKMMHLIPAGIIIVFYYLGIALGPILEKYGWDSMSFTIFLQVTVGIHFLWVMNIGDQIKLRNFKLLGGFARGWMEGAIKPSELDTYTSADPMALGLVLFVLGPIPVLFTACLIGAVADMMASIIGKAFGKKRNPNSPKTIEGYVAGMATSYLIVVLVHTFAPFPGASLLVVQAMALAAAIGFLLVDVYATHIYDNFLNPLVCGLLIWLVYVLLV